MASQVPVGDNSNTKSEEGTTAFYKKRARRVSFAENTSVHIFDRDEDSGTPVNPNPPNSPSDELASAERNDERNVLFWNVEDDNDNNNEDDDNDEPGSRSPFLRFVRSPSSGGSTVGSANSNDEDNFFGPVSANFIRRDLLDSEASDGDHDQTMDSTAFSMHFHSLARSDSEVELKTSTGVHLSFEDKTPTRDSIPTNTGTTSMLMTLAKKPNHQPSASTSKLSTSSESNDMSIVGEYHNKYDYGKLSPTLDALLSEGNSDLPVIDSSNIPILKSAKGVEATKENRANLKDLSGGYDNHLEGINTQKTVNEIVSFKHNELDVVDDGSKSSPSKKIALGLSSDAEISKHLLPSSSNKAIFDDKTNELVKDAFQIKQSYMLSPSIVTPSHDHSSGFVRTEIPKHGWSVPSIQKSISKLRMLEASPFSAALSAKLKDSTSKNLLSCMNDSGRLSSAVEKKRERVSSMNMDDVRLETPMNPIPVTHMQNFVKVASPASSSREKMQTEILSSAEIRNGYQDDKNKFDLHQNFGVSPQKKLKVVNTSEFNSSPLKDANQFTDHSKPLKLVPSHIAGSVENVTNGSLSTTGGEKIDSLYIEKIEKVSPLISIEEEMVDISEVSVHEVHCNSERKEKSTTLLRDEEHEKFETKVTRSDVATEEIKIASPVLHGTTDLQSCRVNLRDLFSQSPLNKKPHNAPHGDEVDPLLEEDVNGDVNPELQRKNEDVLTERIARTHRSPDLGKGYVGLELSTNNRISATGHKFKNLTEITVMLSKETEELLPQSVDEFNLHAVDRLTSILDQLLRSKTYQLLSDEIQSQKSVDVNKYIQQKRSAEMKLLLCKFVHEKAKLQLLHMKRERLLKRVKLLASGIVESEVLRSNLSSQQASRVHCKPLSINMKDLKESEIDSDKVTSMKQALEHIDTQVTNLTKSFHKSCKMKGEPGSGDAVVFVNNYMMKRARCQIIRKDLQLWAIDNLDSRNGSHNVVLNYLDLMTQRLTVNAGLVPSISISHELNNVNISKIFKDMDACTAFGFVFNAGTTKKRANATSLAQETQMTGSLLGNLLDVVEEIHHARIELKNLISTRFHTPLAEQLDLELCFFDSKCRRKATMTLDASCLRRGIYPSEVIPYQIDIPVDDPQICSPSLSAEITLAFKDLTVGYSRIQRLCTCISKLISSPIS